VDGMDSDDRCAVVVVLTVVDGGSCPPWSSVTVSGRGG
jgi:hypothetical protein